MQVDRLASRSRVLLTLREVLTKRHCVLKEVSGFKNKE